MNYTIPTLTNICYGMVVQFSEAVVGCYIPRLYLGYSCILRLGILQYQGVHLDMQHAVE